jgi:integrase
VLDGGEIGRLLDAATTPRYRMLLATAIYTGLRLSELLGLAWSDVDLDGGYLHVPQAARPRQAGRAQDAALGA